MGLINLRNSSLVIAGSSPWDFVPAECEGKQKRREMGKLEAHVYSPKGKQNGEDHGGGKGFSDSEVMVMSPFIGICESISPGTARFQDIYRTAQGTRRRDGMDVLQPQKIRAL